MRSPAEIFADLERRVLTGAGVTSPAARAAAAGTASAGVPAAFGGLLDKIRTAAYRVTDDDIQALTAAGLTDDEIFELTIATTVGVARRRHDAAMAAIAEASS